VKNKYCAKNWKFRILFEKPRPYMKVCSLFLYACSTLMAKYLSRQRIFREKKILIPKFRAPYVQTLSL